jgi:two-component system sensor histidine kinase GlrK
VGPVALPDLVRRVLAEHKLAAFARMVTFEQQLAPARVLGDADQVRTIVDNLVSNAIKYSPRSAPIVVSLGVDGGYAVLDVIDRGPGIEPRERERIFDSFYQGAAPVDGRVKGSGLGLAIAREYALAHGGRIEVRERADGERGAHFRLSLPLATSDAGASGRQGSEPARVTVAVPRVHQ